MIDKNRINTIHTDLRVLLQKFAADNGLAVSPFNISYTPEGFKFAVQMGDKSEIGDVDPILANNTKKFGSWYDLSSTDLGKEFMYANEKVKFLGMKNKTTVIFEKGGDRYKTDATRFATAVGKKVVDVNRGLPFGR